MRTQWLILGGTGIGGVAFVAVLLCRLAHFEGHRSGSTRPVPVPSEVLAPAPMVETIAGSRSGTGPASIAAVNLRRLLLQILRSPQSAIRIRLLAKVRERIEEFEPLLLDILGDEYDPLIWPAIATAEILELRSALLPLVLLASAQNPRTRVAAIRAKNRIEAWSGLEIERLLRDDDPRVLATVLYLTRRQAERPMERILELLKHPDAGVRMAAAAAVPKLDSGPEFDALVNMLSAGAGKDAQAAAFALARPGFGMAAERALMEVIDSPDRILRKSVLQALGTRGSSLSDPKPMLRVAADPERQLGERVAALLAIERTRTATEGLGEVIAGWHPLLRYFGARCMLASGDRAAIPILIDNLAATESESVRSDHATSARTESYDLLFEVTGQTLDTTRATWIRWYRANPDCELHPAQRPPPTSW